MAFQVLIRALGAITLLALSGCSIKMNDGAMGNPSTVAIPIITSDALYVVNGGSNSLTVINTSTNEVAGTIVLKDVTFPHHLSLSPDRGSLSLAVPGMDLSAGHDGGGMAMKMKGAILNLDAATGQTKVSRLLDAPNHNGAFSPDGKEVWTSQMIMSGNILVLDAVTLTTIKIIDVGDMPAEVTFSSDGKYAFVANGMSNNVTIIDVAMKTVLKTLSVGMNPVGAWPGPNGMMYVDNEKSKTLTVIDGAKLDAVKTINLGFMPGMAAIAPNGELWVTNAEDGKVVFFSATDGSKSGELATGANAHGIAFAGDGKTAYVSNQGAGTVSVIDILSKALVKNIPVGAEPNGMAFRKMP